MSASSLFSIHSLAAGSYLIRQHIEICFAETQVRRSVKFRRKGLTRSAARAFGRAVSVVFSLQFFRAECGKLQIENARILLPQAKSHLEADDRVSSSTEPLYLISCTCKRAIFCK